MRRASSVVALAFLGFAAIAAASWLVYWSVKRTQEEAEVAGAPRPPTPRQPQATIIQPRLEAYDEQGKRSWELRLDEAELGRGGDHVAGAGLREGVIYDPETGEGIVHVVGDAVSYDLATKNFELTGNVRIVDNEGLVLTMTRASYVEADKKLVCTGEVVGRDDDVVVTTDKAFYWPHEKVVQCPGEVHCETADGTKLRGRDLRVDLETKKLDMTSVSGNINLEEAESRLEDEDQA